MTKITKKMTEAVKKYAINLAKQKTKELGFNVHPQYSHSSYSTIGLCDITFCDSTSKTIESAGILTINYFNFR